MSFPTLNFFNPAGKSVWLIIIAVLILTTACTSTTDTATPKTNEKIFFPQQEPVDGEKETMTGETFGTLVVIDDCIRVVHDDSDTSWLLIWPPDFSLNTENNTIQILNKDGKVVARIGDMVRIGGGEVLSSAYFDETMKKKLPLNCMAPYWIVGDEVSTIEETK